MENVTELVSAAQQRTPVSVHSEKWDCKYFSNTHSVDNDLVNDRVVTQTVPIVLYRTKQQHLQQTINIPDVRFSSVSRLPAAFDCICYCWELSKSGSNSPRTPFICSIYTQDWCSIEDEYSCFPDCFRPHETWNVELNGGCYMWQHVSLYSLWEEKSLLCTQMWQSGKSVRIKTANIIVLPIAYYCSDSHQMYESNV